MKSGSRTILTLKQKFEIIALFEQGESQASLARKYKISPSSISNICHKKREKILEAYSSRPSSTKKLKQSFYDDLDIQLRDWYLLQRSKKIPINSVLLIEKADQIAKYLKIQDFTCTMSWIQRFKTRHSLVFGSISGEAGDVNNELVASWLKNEWPEIRKGYGNKDIFNADETGLFYRLLPNKTIKVKGERCVGGQLSKDRITLLFCASMEGEKLPPLIIGKSKNPRCFKNVDITSLNYKNNQNAWMTSTIFSNWIMSWDSKLRKIKRNIILLVDNCSSHLPLGQSLTNIELIFMPPNTTSKLQPLDAGVINAFKQYYKKGIVTKMIHFYDSYPEEKFKVSILDAISMVKMAWSKVSCNTIKNCFRHAGFGEVVEEMAINENFSSDIEKYFEKQHSFTDFVNAEENLVTENVNEQEVELNLSLSDTSDNNQCVKLPNIHKAFECMQQVVLFYSNQDKTDHLQESLIAIESDLEKILLKKKTKQRKITEFIFKK